MLQRHGGATERAPRPGAIRRQRARRRRAAGRDPADHPHVRPRSVEHGRQGSLPPTQRGDQQPAWHRRRLLHQGGRRAAHPPRLGDGRGLQRQLPGPPAGGRGDVRQPVQHRSAARRPGARLCDQLAVAVRSPSVGRDPHRGVPAGSRHPPADATTCATSVRGSRSATAGCGARSWSSTARTSPASRRCCPTSRSPTRSRPGGGRGPGPRRAAPPHRHGVALEPWAATGSPMAFHTCASRTGCCPPGRRRSTRSPTPRCGSV